MKRVIEAIKDEQIIRNLKNELKKISYRDYLIFSIGISTGLKINQITNLTVNNIKKESLVLITEEIGRECKMNKDLLMEIRDYIFKNSTKEYLFTSKISKKKHKINSITVNRSFAKACNILGINSISGQTLRKTFGYWYYLENDNNISYLQKIFNHSAPSVTLKYIGIDNRETQKKIALSKKYNFIGRKKQLKDLYKFIQPIDKNEFGGIVYIDGEAGIGKTSLLNEFQKQVSENADSLNYDFLYMPCNEKIQKSLNPIKHFLSDYFNQSNSSTTKNNKIYFEKKYQQFINKLEKFKASLFQNEKIQNTNFTYKQFYEIKMMIDELNRTKSIIGALIDLNWEDSLYEKLDLKTRFENIIYSIKNFIKALSLLNPLVLQIEDAHWIDEDTIKLIKILTRDVKDYPFIIIALNRTDGINKELDFNLEGVSEKRIKLEKFTKVKVKEFIKKNYKSKKFNEKFMNEILDNSNGTPFYIKQIINNSKNNKALTISSTILEKIKVLSSEKQDVIKTAAVMGNRIDLVILGSLFRDMNIYEMKNGFFNISSNNELLFEHAIVKDIIYASLDEYQRCKIHGDIAKTLENKYRKKITTYYEDIAYHYENAFETKKAKSYLEKAANFSQANYSNKKALKYYDKLLKYLDKNSDDRKELLKYIEIKGRYAKVLEFTGSLDEAFTIYQNILKIAKKIKSEIFIHQINIQIGDIYIGKSEFKKAFKCFKDDLKISTQQKNNERIGTSIGNIGAVYSAIGEYDKSIKYFKKLLTIGKKNNNKEQLGIAYANMGLALLNKGLYEKAIYYLKKHLKIVVSLNDRKGLLAVYGNLGSVYIEKGNYDEALKYGEKSLNISKQLGYRHGISQALSLIGEIYGIIGDYDKSLEYFNKSNRIDKELNDRLLLFISYNNIATIYRKRDEYVKAEECYDKVIPLGRELNMKHYLCQALYSNSDLLYKQQKFENADKKNDEAITLAKESGRVDIVYFANILKEKIKFNLSDKTLDKLKTIGNLESLLSEEKDIEHIAALNYEIALLFYKLSNDKYLIYKNKAITIFKELYKDNPIMDFRKIYEELDKL